MHHLHVYYNLSSPRLCKQGYGSERHSLSLAHTAQRPLITIAILSVFMQQPEMRPFTQGEPSASVQCHVRQPVRARHAVPRDAMYNYPFIDAYTSPETLAQRREAVMWIFIGSSWLLAIVALCLSVLALNKTLK